MAVWPDGTVLGGNELPGWNWPADRPRFQGRELFDQQDHVRLIRDTTRRTELEAPYVVMTNGDVVTGRVARYAAAEAARSVPTHLVLELRGDLGCYSNDELPVRLDRVRSIVVAVGEPDEDRRPGLRTLDGRRLVARAIRWRESGVTVLTENEIERVEFEDLAELHLPAEPGLDPLRDDRVFPSPRPDAIVARLATRRGAVVTFRREILRGDSRSLGGQRTTVHVVRPSWSLQPVCVAVDSIVQRGYRRADRYPLSALPATRLRAVSAIHHLTWKRDLNVLGGPLHSGQLMADQGVGTHSHSEIAFALPAGATKLNGWVGIDRTAGEGGCARGRIHRDDVAGDPLWASGFLRGRQPPERFDDLDLRGADRVVLVTELAHDGRPAGADPLDIRDLVDWLLPLVDVEPDVDDDRRFAFRFLPGLSTWETTSKGRRALEFLPPVWDDLTGSWPIGIRSAGTEPVVFTRQEPVTRDDEHLILQVEPVGSLPDDAVVLTADDRPIDARALSLGRQTVLLWDLTSFRAKSPRLRLSLATGDQTGGLRWIGMGRSSTVDVLPKLPADERSFRLWRMADRELTDAPERRRRLRRDLLEGASTVQAFRWVRCFLENEKGPIDARKIEDFEGLIRETSHGDELLRLFRAEAIPTR